ncbi:MAG: hypothetical protein ACI9XK_001720 [Granulosicoccus sp.]|jgi:hypothetical protein
MATSPQQAVRPLALTLLLSALSMLLWNDSVLAHAVTQGDKGYIQEISGVTIIPFIYLGAKHMVTGYDHILFLIGVIFFLYGMKQIALYVSLFAIGHSITMLAGVYFNFGINSYIIDAVIGFSVVYKALDNLGAFVRWFGFQPDTRIATLVFGLLHGFGLASKIIEYDISADGLIPNLLAFNVGVEIGQLLALAAILLLMKYWRASASFAQQAYAANVMLLTSGFTLMGFQIAGFVVTELTHIH